MDYVTSLASRAPPPYGHGAREIGGSHENLRGESVLFSIAVREPCLSGRVPTVPLKLAQNHFYLFYKVRILIHIIPYIKVIPGYFVLFAQAPDEGN